MALSNARLHKEALNKLFYDAWYDPKYQYYFGGDQRWTPWFGNEDSDQSGNRNWAVLNKDGVVIGYIGYSWNANLRIACNFGAINFSDDKMTFALALKQVVKDIFELFNANVMEWSVVCGNPVEESYDKMCQRYHGRILCKREGRARDLAGNLHADKLYEITKAGYQAAMEERRAKNEL